MLSVSKENEYKKIELSKLRTAPFARKVDKDGEDVKSLSNSITSQGLLHPIVVTELDDGTYEIVAGNRRRAAVEMAGRKEVECIVIPSATPSRDQLISLMENVQRQDLSIDERADITIAIIKLYEGDKGEVARKLGYPLSVINQWIDAKYAIEAVKRKATAKDTAKVALVSKLPADKQNETFDLVKPLEYRKAKQITKEVGTDQYETPKNIANKVLGEVRETTVNVHIRGDIHEVLRQEADKKNVSKATYIADVLEAHFISLNLYKGR